MWNVLPYFPAQIKNFFIATPYIRQHSETRLKTSRLKLQEMQKKELKANEANKWEFIQ